MFRLPSTKKNKFGATILVQPSPPRGEIYLFSAGRSKKRKRLRVSDNDWPVASVRDKRGLGAGRERAKVEAYNTFALPSCRISNQNERLFPHISRRQAVGFG